ncbi:MAG: 1,4-alpha-glucan branching protein GlgB [Saprospiraceae bacterium]|nr:1,4-alpha-glucan branching protein GlgB [Saprospiraceae bacterium]
MPNHVKPYSRFTDFDISLFKSGKHFRLYEHFGSHIVEHDGEMGVYFAVYAPAAKVVTVIGDFNFWAGDQHILQVRWDASGIWEGFVPGLKQGDKYKYRIFSNHDGVVTEKADPYARYCEHPPYTASLVWPIDYTWSDGHWMEIRKEKQKLSQPMSVYEVHLGSWRRPWHEDRPFSYQEHIDQLVPYVKEMGFTHVELMPVMEHPYTPSWGYQITGFYAPTSRFGTPQDFKRLIDAFHAEGIGVILDWVPSHFPEDAHGLGKFDGTAVYEHPDLRKGYHQDWKSLIFNYERNEVRSFLISSAIFWLHQYHIDGLRVDAVASMLYLDYSREAGGWEPNIYGGNENLAAISFLKDFNEAVYVAFPDVQTIAEESTSFARVSRPVFMGGLGFGLKWMMGWMNDTLRYFKTDPFFRRYHQNTLTFSMMYAFTENFTLPLSHDEVVHGKASLINKMPGDYWQQFANLRTLFSYMFTHPGSKLLFMGGEIAQFHEWKFDSSLDWNLLSEFSHLGVQNVVKALNHLYQSEKALHEHQYQSEGFEWLDCNDVDSSVISYIRKSSDPQDFLMIICNFTPVPRHGYQLGCPPCDSYTEIFNSDDSKYWGSGIVNIKPITVAEVPKHFRTHSLEVELPPLGVSVLKPNFPVKPKKKKNVAT